MKSKIITGLKKEVLVIELPENGYWETYRDGTEIRDFLTDEKFVTDYTILGKPDEISEEYARELVESWESVAKDGTWIYENYLGGRIPKKKTALESLLSALESEIYWENPHGKEEPNKSYFLDDNGSFLRQDKKQWYEAQEKTFDKNRTLIFVKD